MTVEIGEGYRFDRFTLSVARASLQADGADIDLRPKSFDVLRYLVERAGRIATKDEIVTAVWPNVVVTDDSLTQCVRDVRRAIDDDGERFIKTVPRRGYMFVAEVLPLGGQAAANSPNPRRWQLPAAMVVAMILLAALTAFAGWSGGFRLVVPSPEPELAAPPTAIVEVTALENPDGDADAMRAARQMGRELFAELSRSGRIIMIDAGEQQPRGPQSEHYRIEGTVYEGGEEVRLDIKLVSGEPTRLVWSERYDIGRSPLSEVHAALGAHAIARRETHNPQAAVAFVRGWHHYQRRELWADRIALAAFNEAVTLDAGFSRAHAALAALYWRCGLHRCGGEGRDLGLTSWAAVWDRAEQHLELAMKSPTSLAHQVASQMLLQQSRRQEALGEARLAVALDPYDGDGLATLAEVLTIVGLPLEALTELERVKGTDLEHSRLYHRALGRALFAIGRHAEAAAALQQAVALLPADKASLELLTAAYGYLGRAREAGEAAVALHELMQRHWRIPNLIYRLDIAEFDAAMQLPADRARLLEGLRLAGIPD